MFKGDVIRKNKKPAQAVESSQAQQPIVHEEQDPQRVPLGLRRFAKAEQPASSARPTFKRDW